MKRKYSNTRILEFVTAGPKNYAYRHVNGITGNDEQFVVKMARNLWREIWGSKLGDRNLGTEIWGSKFGDRNLGTEISGSNFGDRILGPKTYFFSF